MPFAEVLWLLEKKLPYDRAFRDHPVNAHLETNFSLGPDASVPPDASVTTECVDPAG